MKLNKPEGIAVWLQMFQCYREAFPPSERKPFWVICQMYRRKKADLWYWEKEGHFAGFATTVNGKDQILLDYFAVAGKFRGNGIGTQALAELQKNYADKGLFVEIERVDPDAPNSAQREKRKQFYLRSGMEELGVQAEVFGVEMELLGSRCAMTFADYHAFYRDFNSPWAAEHIRPME